MAELVGKAETAPTASRSRSGSASVREKNIQVFAHMRARNMGPPEPRPLLPFIHAMAI